MVLAQTRNDKDTLQEGMSMLMESCGKKQGLCRMERVWEAKETQGGIGAESFVKR